MSEYEEDIEAHSVSLGLIRTNDEGEPELLTISKSNIDIAGTSDYAVRSEDGWSFRSTEDLDYIVQMIDALVVTAQSKNNKKGRAK